MLRRLKFFAAGVLISVLVLSMGPENRLKNTFYAYVDYFNPEKRVISQLSISDSIVGVPEISEKDLQNIYNMIDNQSASLKILYSHKDNDKVVRISE